MFPAKNGNFRGELVVRRARAAGLPWREVPEKGVK